MATRNPNGPRPTPATIAPDPAAFARPAGFATATAVRTPRWPAALKPGVRITYLAGHGFSPPALTTTTTSPTATSTSTTPPEVGASGSQTLEQLTITGRTADRLSLDVRAWGLDTVNNRLLTSAMPTAYVVGVASGNEYWQPPDVLAGLAEGNQGDGLNVHRLDYPLNGRTYKAMRITGAGGAYNYDLASGLLLFWSNRSTGSTGVRSVSTRSLLGTRLTQLPWNGQSPGGDVKGLQRVDFSGTSTLSAALSTWTNGRSLRWDVKSTDELGLVVHRTSVDDPRTGAPPTVVQDDAFLPLPTVWIDPRTLAALRQGQVLDQDAVTHGRTTVASVANGTVSIADQVVNETTTTSFDTRTGLLTAVKIEYRLPDSLTTTLLRRTV